MHANPELAKLLDETIGTEWRKDATKLETLKAFRHDAIVREKLDKIKIDNKKTFKCLPTRKTRNHCERKFYF